MTTVNRVPCQKLKRKLVASGSLKSEPESEFVSLSLQMRTWIEIYCKKLRRLEYISQNNTEYNVLSYHLTKEYFLFSFYSSHTLIKSTILSDGELEFDWMGILTILWHIGPRQSFPTWAWPKSDKVWNSVLVQMFKSTFSNL